MTKRTTQRIVIDVRWEDDQWVVRVGKGSTKAQEPRGRFASRAQRMSRAVALAKEIEWAGGTFQVRVFNKNGAISREMTYPRSSDPRRSKG